MGLKPKKIGLKILLLSEKIKIKRFLGQICRLGRFGQSYNLKIKFSSLSVDAAFGFFYTDNDRLPLNRTRNILYINIVLTEIQPPRCKYNQTWCYL